MNWSRKSIEKTQPNKYKYITIGLNSVTFFPLEQTLFYLPAINSLEAILSICSVSAILYTNNKETLMSSIFFERFRSGYLSMFRKILEEMFLQYYMHIEGCSGFKSSTPPYCVTSTQKGLISILRDLSQTWKFSLFYKIF